MRTDIVLASLALLLLLPHAKSYHLSNVDVVVWINDDGSFNVSERLTFSFSGEFSFAYREIPLVAPLGRTIRVSDIKVYEGAREIEPELSMYGGVRKIVWRYSARDEERTFTLTYRVDGQILKYDDVADFYWKFHGERWEVGADRVHATVFLPEGVGANETWAWGHGPLTGVTTIGNRTAEFEVIGVPSRTFVEGRVVFPSEAISGEYAIRKQGEGFQNILDEEKNNFFERDGDAGRWVSGLVLIVPFIPPLMLICLVGALWYAYGREPKVAFSQKYFHEPPYDYPPAVLGTLMDASTKKPGADQFTATVMDLAQRGYMKLEEVKREKGFFEFFKSNKDIRITVLRGPDEKLKSYEKRVFGMLFGKRDIFTLAAEENPWARILNMFGEQEHEEREEGGLKGKSLLLSELMADRKFRRYFRASFQIWQKRAHDAGRKYRFHEEKASRIATNVSVFTLVLVVFSFAGVGLFFAKEAEKAGVEDLFFPGVFISIVMCILIAAYGYKALQQRTSKGALHYEKWKAFKRFLSDMTLLKQYPPSSVAMWDRYLVYATALGCADKVVEAMKVQLGEGEYRPGWFSSSTGAGALGGLSALNSSFGSFSASSGSSGSGGSFGGGGGSGGGGGGGGAG